jgi:hypothetical protein
MPPAAAGGETKEERSMKRYVIIGNAGASAVEQIRARDTEGGITIFTRETHPFYSQWGLIPKNLLTRGMLRGGLNW